MRKTGHRVRFFGLVLLKIQELLVFRPDFMSGFGAGVSIQRGRVRATRGSQILSFQKHKNEHIMFGFAESFVKNKRLINF
jgi:hypothetical protein